MTAPDPAPTDRNGIQVIARAAAILRAVEAGSAALSLGDLAGRLRLPRSTVQRIVSALIEEGLLISAGPRSGVALGPALVRMAATAMIDTERLARPLLQDLSAATGETADLSVLQQGRAVFVDQVVGKARLVALSAVGESFPLHCTANGKALLSQLSDERRDRLLRGRLRRQTERTITSRAALYQELEEVKRTGIAWDLQEHSHGICAVGTAFTDPMGRHFALSIPVPAARFAAKRALLGRAVLKVGADLKGLRSVADDDVRVSGRSGKIAAIR